jgi:hypothetical protein
MPITLSCICGKALRVGEQFAGKSVKCPVCGAIQQAEPPPVAAASDTSDDIEVLEDTPAVPLKLPPLKPLELPPPEPVRPRVKAAAVAEEPPPSSKPAGATITGEPRRRKKKKRNKSDAPAQADDWYERMRDREVWMKRVFRGSAFIVLGITIVAGVSILYFGYREDVQWLQDEGGRAKLGLIFLAVLGLAAVGKGAIGLVCGQFLGEDD